VKFIYKLIDLDSLSVYMDCDTRMIGDLPTRDAIKAEMVARVATKSNTPSTVSYRLFTAVPNANCL
jgi:hypothetical protein